jgi:hypothetical protein
MVDAPCQVSAFWSRIRRAEGCQDFAAAAADLTGWWPLVMPVAVLATNRASVIGQPSQKI